MADQCTNTGFTHHVIGAVHEVFIDCGDPDVLTTAVDHELVGCAAMRIVIDLTGLREVTDAHIEALRPLTADSDRAAALIGHQAFHRRAALEAIGLRVVITPSPPGPPQEEPGRTGLPARPPG
jgi:hypothetical protein